MSHRRILLSLALLCCLAAPAAGTVTIIAGNHITGKHGVIAILLASDIPQGVQSVDLGLEIGDGFSGPGPLITNVDMTSPGTIFGDAPGGHTVQSDFESYPTRNQLSSIATISGDTFPAAGGVLAFVTIDATGIPEDFYPFRLTYAPFFLPTGSSSIPSQGPTILVDGSIIPEPEPSSLLLGLFAAAGLGVVAIRRRRIRGKS